MLFRSNRELGDRPFYWKASPEAKEKVLVWHAGKGYSYFHAIASDDKQAAWESRISAYCDQLTATGYPYDIVQLRYTQHADNGPVDTSLVTFVNEWNRRFSSPRLEVYNLDSLFKEFESKYGGQLPVWQGEISPYWEDGAYSTTKEEVANRELAQNTIQMEAWAKANGSYQINKDAFGQLHR